MKKRPLYEMAQEMVNKAVADSRGRWSPDPERLDDLKTFCEILESVIEDSSVDVLDTEFVSPAHEITFTFEIPSCTPSDDDDLRLKALLLLASLITLQCRGDRVKVKLSIKV